MPDYRQNEFKMIVGRTFANQITASVYCTDLSSGSNLSKMSSISDRILEQNALLYINEIHLQ